MRIPDWQIPAHVITMVPTADRQKATVLVRIGFKALDPRILPDMGVKVTFLRDDGDGDRRGRAGSAGRESDARAEGGDPDRQRTQLRVRRRRAIAVERRAVKTGGTDGDRLEVARRPQRGRARDRRRRRI